LKTLNDGYSKNHS
jgi:hypothetical protein